MRASLFSNPLVLHARFSGGEGTVSVFFVSLFFCEPVTGRSAPAAEFLGSLTDLNSGSRQLPLELFIGSIYQGQFTGSDCKDWNYFFVCCLDIASNVMKLC